MDGWVDGWVGGWMDGWMGGWMDGPIVFVWRLRLCHLEPKKHSLQTVEVSRGSQTAVQIVSKTPAPSNRSIKAGDVETNPGPTTTHKQVSHKPISHLSILNPFFSIIRSTDGDSYN